MKGKSKMPLKIEVDTTKGATLKDVADKAVANQRFKEKQSRSKSSSKTGRSWDNKNDMEHAYRGPNDINWRNKVSSLMSLAARIPFGQPLGLTYDREFVRDFGNLESGSVPGVMCVDVAVVAGNSTDYNSPLNLAIRKSYSFIRHANSGSKNYEAADLGLYYLSIAQALALLGWLKRIYVHAMSFSATNRYWPEVILRANRVNYTDIRMNLPNLAYLIGWFSNAIGSLAFPKFSYFEMAEDAFLHVYKDSESPKEQLYMFTPKDFAIYNPVYSSTGGGVEYTNVFSTAPNTGATFAWLSSLVHSVMDVLLGDEDMGIISGDILKAYGEDRYIPKTVSVAEVATPLYSVEILEQIHNLEFCDHRTPVVYYQNPGTANTAPFIELTMSGSSYVFALATDKEIPYTGLHELDAFGRDPTVDEVINCCVLKNISVPTITPGSGSGTYNVAFDNPTFEGLFPYGIRIAYGVGTAYAVITSNYVGAGDIIINIDQSNSFASTGVQIDDIIYASNFDWAPLTRTLNMDDEVHNIGDIHNMTLISFNTLARIHEAALLSLFGFTDMSAK